MRVERVQVVFGEWLDLHRSERLCVRSLHFVRGKRCSMLRQQRLRLEQLQRVQHQQHHRMYLEQCCLCLLLGQLQRRKMRCGRNLRKAMQRGNCDEDVQRRIRHAGM